MKTVGEYFEKIVTMLELELAQGQKAISIAERIESALSACKVEPMSERALENRDRMAAIRRISDAVLRIDEMLNQKTIDFIDRDALLELRRILTKHE